LSRERDANDAFSPGTAVRVVRELVVCAGVHLMAKNAVSTPTAPAPVGPYSQAVRIGDIVATAGQVGIDPATGEPAGGDVVAQTRQTIQNLDAVLRAAGASLHDIIRVGVFLTDVTDFDAMNDVYRELIPEPHPARTTVYVGLPAGLKVEIDALAVADAARGRAGRPDPSCA
jgi:2-iminobutanoate/2-iminopropanoate deaminase